MKRPDRMPVKTETVPGGFKLTYENGDTFMICDDIFDDRPSEPFVGRLSTRGKERKEMLEKMLVMRHKMAEEAPQER